MNSECARNDATGTPFDLRQQVTAYENEANDQRSLAPNQKISVNDEAVDNEVLNLKDRLPSICTLLPICSATYVTHEHPHRF